VTEKVAVCISTSAQAKDLIARGARLAEGLGGEFYVVHVQSPKDDNPERKRTLEASLLFARNLGAQVVQLSGKNIPSTTAAFVTEHRITQAIFGRSALHGLRKYLYYLAIQRFMSEAPHVDLHIVTQENH
jgi:two-component system sensor histidine kinase KdpD